MYAYIMYVDVVFLLQFNIQDQILLQWEGGDLVIMYVLVVYVMIIFFIYGFFNGKFIQEMIVVIEKRYIEWLQMIVLIL